MPGAWATWPVVWKAGITCWATVSPSPTATSLPSSAGATPVSYTHLGLRLADRDELHFLQFADRELSPRVEHGRQALAIDEHRADFTPTPWAEREGVKQVWFAGAHADVGGGYENHGLSDIALEWMMQEINDLDAGLQLAPDQLSEALAPDSLEDRHDETRGPIWRTRPSKARKILSLIHI